jgi:SWI/SNF-related matrix-associated actin-dependent regulator 1 of chromatin subfamily A
MPRHNYINVYFEMGEWQSEYRKAIYDHLHDSGKLAIESAIHSINLVMAKAKVPGIIEAIEALVESGEKVVVFCSYSSPLEDMRSHFGDACIVIDGKNHDKMTDAKRFKEDPTCMVALCNTKAAGHTIDLSVSSNLYVVNFPLSPKELEQASDRVKNLAKHHPCNVHFCIALGNDNVQTVDERLRELIGGKDADINWLLDGKEAKGVQEDVAEVLWREILLQYKSNEEAVGETVATGPGE